MVAAHDCWTRAAQRLALFQAVLQGVLFMGVHVLRSKMLILLHEKKDPENRKNEENLQPPLRSPVKKSMTIAD